MKKRLLRIMIGLLINISPAMAGNNQSMFLLRSETGMVTVSVDNKYFGEPTEKFSIDRMAPGEHYIQIYGDRLVKHGRTYVHERAVLYAGKVFIRPASVVKSVIEKNGRFYVKDVMPINTVQNYNQYGSYEQYGDACGGGYMTVMNMNAFSQLMDVIRAQYYEDSKLAVAMQALDRNLMSSEQVKEIMHLFYYEDSKLKFAEAAYSRVIDPQTYYIVNKEFYYSSSVEALSEYIRCH